MSQQWIGKEMYRYTELSSTNTEAKRLAEEGASHGTVVVAEAQTAGRGRRGRQWISPAGKGLWFSMILRPDIQPKNASVLTLVAALAVNKAIFYLTEQKSQIKWPNDIVMEQKKVCGILAELYLKEQHIDYIILGIGINVDKQEFSEELKTTATSLENICGKKISKEQLLSEVLQDFADYYKCYEQTGNMSLLLEEYNACLVNCNREVCVLEAQGAYEGIARGINLSGELLVEQEHILHRVNAGEVSVRGIYGYV